VDSKAQLHCVGIDAHYRPAGAYFAGQEDDQSVLIIERPDPSILVAAKDSNGQKDGPAGIVCL
jgi:hypothetical protein